MPELPRLTIPISNSFRAILQNISLWHMGGLCIIRSHILINCKLKKLVQSWIIVFAAIKLSQVRAIVANTLQCVSYCLY